MIDWGVSWEDCFGEPDVLRTNVASGECIIRRQDGRTVIECSTSGTFPPPPSPTIES